MISQSTKAKCENNCKNQSEFCVQIGKVKVNLCKACAEKLLTCLQGVFTPKSPKNLIKKKIEEKAKEIIYG